ncbi:fibrinogen C domain-containing protein 1-like [Musca vetustissima]|uniref:fibrinogen C domain-containing protein 1-like n=1 Tax=Musca vetustissima TaxID=27455 RepID=UPI002AB71FB3|nr:fibrinogen C domain-containing protein 1-like [Musca vetustissima]
MKILFLLVIAWTAINLVESHLTIGVNDDPVPEHNNAGLWSVLYAKINILLNETTVLRENIAELRERQNDQESNVATMLENFKEETNKLMETSINNLKRKYEQDEDRFIAFVDNMSAETKVYLENGFKELQERQDLQEEKIGKLIESVVLNGKQTIEETQEQIQKSLNDQEVRFTTLMNSISKESQKYMETHLEELRQRQELSEERVLQHVENTSSNAQQFLEKGFDDMNRRQDQQEEQIGTLIESLTQRTQQSVDQTLDILQQRLAEQEVRIAHLMDSLRMDSKEYMEKGLEELGQRLIVQEDRIAGTLENITAEAQKSLEQGLEGVKQGYSKLEDRQNLQHNLSLKILENTAPKPYSFGETPDILSLNQHREWTTISRRLDGSVAFDLGWENYKNGFGNPNGEFFIGLEQLHALTNYGATQELLVILRDYQNQTRYAKYDIFRVGSELKRYAITELGSYSGDAGDSLRAHAGAPFITKDNNDGSFPVERGGGWWRSVQSMCDLHSYYQPVDNVYGIFWGTWNGWKYTLKSAEMMIRSKR